MIRFLPAMTAGAVACTAVGTGAQPTEEILSFGFSDLDASFNIVTGDLTAVGGSLTSGDVTRIDDVAGPTADFDMGFVGGTAAVSLNFNVNDGTGSFQITDATGDTLGGAISGQIAPLGSSFVINGALSSVNINDLSGDGTFDGPSSGSFSSAFPGFLQNFGGSIINLAFGDDLSFEESFDDARLNSNAIIRATVPTPGTLALLGMGGLLAARRRRR